MNEVRDKTFGEVVREYFPEATDDDIEHILWGQTGYPCFWETDDTEACLRKRLQEFREVKSRGIDRG
mgnify:CR=1 FL=1